MKKWSWLLLLPIGTCIYLFINYKITGDPLYFIKIQEKIWGENTQLCFITIGKLWSFILSEYPLDLRLSAFLPGLIMIFSIFGLTLYAIPRHKNMYTIYILIYIIVHTSISWPISLPRYLVSIVPVYMILGEICEKHKKVDTILTVSFGILFGVYLTAYLLYKNVM